MYDRYCVYILLPLLYLMDRTLRDEWSISNEIKAVTLVHIGVSSEFWWKVSTLCICVIVQAWWEYCVKSLSSLISRESLIIHVGIVSSYDVYLKTWLKIFSFSFPLFLCNIFPFSFLWKCVKIKAVSLWCWFQGTSNWYLLHLSSICPLVLCITVIISKTFM